MSSAAAVRKTVSVLFCDLAGSTALGEHLDPESFRAVMAAWHDAMRGPLERHGGTVEKFIGDAVMAVFGVPQVHEDDALRAVRAAVEMREALAALNAGLAAHGRPALRIRIGVNTGEVVAGDGDDGTLVTGDAVNTAKRLEQAAGPDEILIGEPTRRLVRQRGAARAVRGDRREGEERAGRGVARPRDDRGRGVVRPAPRRAVRRARRRAVDAPVGAGGGRVGSARAASSRCSARPGSASRGSRPSSPRR